MKKITQFTLVAILAAVLCSGASLRRSMFNANSWSVSAGKKLLLASWKHHNMGDTAVIDIRNIKPADTLYTTQFLCGYNGLNATITLTIKDDQGREVAQHGSSTGGKLYVGKLALHTLLASGKFIPGKVWGVYVSICSVPDPIDQTVLIARLCIK